MLDNKNFYGYNKIVNQNGGTTLVESFEAYRERVEAENPLLKTFELHLFQVLRLIYEQI